MDKKVSKSDWGFLIALLGVPAALFTLFGYTSNLKTGLWVSAVAGVSIIAIAFIKLLKNRYQNAMCLSPTKLDVFIEERLKTSSEWRCIFSLGDLFIRNLTDALQQRTSGQVSVTVKVLLRERPDDDAFQSRLEQNCRLLKELETKYAIKIIHKVVPWDYFMLSGIVSADGEGALNFYYRENNQTRRVADTYFKVSRGGQAYESLLIEAFDKAFEAMWATSS